VVQESVEDYGVTDRAKKVENPTGIDDLAAEASLRALEAWKQSWRKRPCLASPNTAAYVMNEKDVFETQHLTQGASAWADNAPLGAITIATNSVPPRISTRLSTR